MFTTPSETRSLAFAAVITQIFSLLVIAYAFLVPMPLSYAILIGLSISLMLTIADTAQIYIDFSRHQTLEQVWIWDLATQLAVDDILSKVRLGRDVEVDWREMMRAAAEDLKTSHADRYSADQLGSGPFLGATLSIVFIPIILFGRLVLGWGLAIVVEKFAPGFAQWAVPA